MIDDGLATGSTMKSAVVALRRQGPTRLVVAVPIATPFTCEEFQDEVDEVVCARTPEPFYAVGVWYEDFSQTTDDEMRSLLARASVESGRVGSVSGPPQDRKGVCDGRTDQATG